MKKDELLKLKPLTATADMIRAKNEDLPEKRIIYGRQNRPMRNVYTYRYYRFYRAAVENGILKVGIWQRCNLVAKGQQPDYTIFIDNESGEWLTYGAEGWTKAKIFNLDYAYEEGQKFGLGNWNSPGSLKAAASYLGITGATVKEIVRKFQTSDLKTTVYHKNEMEQIDEFMEAVPELPKGFNNDWLARTAFIDLASIMYHPGKKVTEGYCTRCRSTVQITDKPRHLKKTKCPHCKALATYRSWNRQGSFERKKWVGIIQKLSGTAGYCLSQYEVQVIYQKENDYREPEIRQGRVERYRLSEWFGWHESFAYEEYRHTGVTRWSHAHTSGMNYSYRNPSPWCVLYEKNITALLKDTEAKYVPVTDWLRANAGKQINPSEMLGQCVDQADMLEKLIKAKMMKLVSNVWDEKCEELNVSGKRLQDILGLNAENTRLAREMNCTRRELQIIKQAERAHVQMDADLVRDIDDLSNGYMGADDMYLFIAGKNLRKTVNYLKKVKDESGNRGYIVRRDYEDYLHQLHRLGIPADRHSRFPANFYHTHELLSAQIEELDSEIEKASTRKKNVILKKTVARMKPLYDTKSKKFMIVWPMSKADFAREGQLQHNCVGGYFERCTKGETTVFFVRNADEPDKPYATVEFDEGRLVQCRIAYNRNAPADVMEYIDRIAEHYRRAIEELQKEA